MGGLMRTTKLMTMDAGQRAGAEHETWSWSEAHLAEHVQTIGWRHDRGITSAPGIVHLHKASIPDCNEGCLFLEPAKQPSDAGGVTL